VPKNDNKLKPKNKNKIVLNTIKNLLFFIKSKFSFFRIKQPPVIATKIVNNPDRLRPPIKVLLVNKSSIGLTIINPAKIELG
jgi:hypothetical protein